MYRRKKYDVITKDSAICSVALSRERKKKRCRSVYFFLEIMPFTARSDKASHFAHVICCDQWRLLYAVSTQKMPLWYGSPRRAVLSRIRAPPLKQIYAFATHLSVYQIIFTQKALLRKKKKKRSPSRLIFLFFSPAEGFEPLWPQSTYNKAELHHSFMKRWAS